MDNKLNRSFDHESNDLVMKLMGSCHSIRKISDKLEGDELDIEIFKHSQYHFH